MNDDPLLLTRAALAATLGAAFMAGVRVDHDLIEWAVAELSGRVAAGPVAPDELIRAAIARPRPAPPVADAVTDSPTD